ncbi:MAG: hemerythrin domain-containing protein, partial [Hydrogenophaga sp.]|nr:hemerythrin domain-containing protein [Hydrogenophaga sp.]
REVLRRVSEGASPTWSGLSETERAALARFAGLYADHIRAEEDSVYPAVSARIDAPAQHPMGAEMAARRTARP